MKKQEIFAVMVIGKTTPSVTYDNYEEAEIEAKRLAIKERPLIVYVLRVVAKLETSEVVVTRLDV